MNKERLQDLFERYQKKDLSPLELLEWDTLIHDPNLEPDLEEILDKEWYDYDQQEQAILNLEKAEAIYQNVLADSRGSLKVKRLWPRIAVAAAIAIIVLGAGLFYISNPFIKRDQTAAYANDIGPGKQGATLTLANGRKIRLSAATNGTLTKEAGVSITKTANGQVVYRVIESRAQAYRPPISSPQFNTLSTAKGETYKVTLPDGSAIWLNAASSLTYPVSFAASKNRKVELEGEAYFEIAKDKQHPFIVEIGKQDVEVLGTHFNINGYADEPEVKTTLLEGSVRLSLISSGRPSNQVNPPSSVLVPGEQAVNTGSEIKIKKVDVANVIGWKNNDFVFNGKTFGAAMHEISRWYNVDIIYDAAATANIEPGGWISRKSNISVVLKRIESSGQVHFKIEGRRIIVTE